MFVCASAKCVIIPGDSEELVSDDRLTRLWTPKQPFWLTPKGLKTTSALPRSGSLEAWSSTTAVFEETISDALLPLDGDAAVSRSHAIQRWCF